ncbi:hypothetical protein RDV89_00005 [Nocardioides zeae]|uniref:Uncharacterized protein n=1 Tax=Nocardioides imazamoxiresistens TaxID=3231893 RepID=A0ABU3PRB6_9ACTN|nr:hypothetical protein [Nocardioides zeae]MDT9591426.1 hypothetical protein [Nocardioides zeae]
MNAFGLVLTVVVMLGVALFILLFERRRSEGIQRDLRQMADERRDTDNRSGDPSRRGED